jgi:hypothetical protein
MGVGAVYGPTRSLQKEQFLTKLAHTTSLPIMMVEISIYLGMPRRKIKGILRVGGLFCLIVLLTG